MIAPQEFLRVQATYRGRLDVEDWFIEHLPNPDFYATGTPSAP